MRAYHPCPPAVMQLKQTPGYECLADRTSERDDIHNRCILLREISTADCILYLYTPANGVQLIKRFRNRAVAQNELDDLSRRHLGW